MDWVLRGQVWKFGDNVPGDNGIIPFSVVTNIYEEDRDQLAHLCMTPIDPDFPKKFRKGDFIIAGKNFPTGIAHEQAIWAIRDLGVAAVISETMNGGFFEACINEGVPALPAEGISQMVDSGDQLEVNLKSGEIVNLTTDQTLRITPVPDRIAQILEAGGLKSLLRRKLAAQQRTKHTGGEHAIIN